MSAPPIDQDQDDEEYASFEDSDFAPDAVPAPESEADESESEDDPAARDRPSKRTRTAAGDANGADDVGYDNSGDEAIIKRGEKKKQKKRSKEGRATAADEEDDDGGEGGLIKTRRQRAAEKEERRVAVSNGPVTIDVDAVWAQMLSGDPAASGVEAKSTESANADAETSNATAAGESKSQPQPSPTADPSALVRIKRTYNFAGKVHSEEKLVPRDSAEAKLFFASQGRSEDAAAAAAVDASPPKRRIVRKAFRSRFEPQIDMLPKRVDLDLSVTGRTKAGREAQAKKLNTVEKSRMDWASFVDKEGIKDELELAGRAKGSFAAREDFLARSEAKRQEDALRARKTGRA